MSNFALDSALLTIVRVYKLYLLTYILDMLRLAAAACCDRG